jgi:hypothetical protein
MTMSEQRTTPAPLHGLRLLRGDTKGGTAGGDTAADTQGDTAPMPLPVPGAEIVPLSLAERIRLAVSRWAGTAARIAGRIWAPFGRALHSLLHPEPETMTEHRAYIRSMAWVPEELRGRKSARVIAVLGVIYHVAIGHPLKASMKAVVKAAQNIDQAAERPQRIFMFAVFVPALILILLNL